MGQPLDLSEPLPRRLAAATDPGGWEAVMVPPPDDETREGIRFLVDLDPYSTLCFDDDTTVEVAVEYSGDDDCLQLSEVSEPVRPAASR